MTVRCPACQRACSTSPNIDAASCPEHGYIDGRTFDRASFMPGFLAGIEIRAAQAHDEIRELADAAREFINRRTAQLLRWQRARRA